MLPLHTRVADFLKDVLGSVPAQNIQRALVRLKNVSLPFLMLKDQRIIYSTLMLAFVVDVLCSFGIFISPIATPIKIILALVIAVEAKYFWAVAQSYKAPKNDFNALILLCLAFCRLHIRTQLTQDPFLLKSAPDYSLSVAGHGFLILVWMKLSWRFEVRMMGLILSSFVSAGLLQPESSYFKSWTPYDFCFVIFLTVGFVSMVEMDAQERIQRKAFISVDFMQIQGTSPIERIKNMLEKASSNLKDNSDEHSFGVSLDLIEKSIEIMTTTENLYLYQAENFKRSAWSLVVYGKNDDDWDTMSLPQSRFTDNTVVRASKRSLTMAANEALKNMRRPASRQTEDLQSGLEALRNEFVVSCTSGLEENESDQATPVASKKMNTLTLTPHPLDAARSREHDPLARFEWLADIKPSKYTKPDINQNYIAKLKSYIGNNWEYTSDDPLQNGDSQRIFIECGYTVFQPYIQEGDLLCSDATLLSFLSTVDAFYHNNPYHNARHAVTVMHSALFLAKKVIEPHGWPKWEQIAMILASLCHDVGHPGKNNAFFVNSLDPLAVMYNDQSVLENYHSSLTFSILHQPECDIFENVELQQFREFRKKIIDLILATDLKSHFDSMSRVKVRIDSKNFDFSSNEERGLVEKMLMVAADISHCAKSWPCHMMWAEKLKLEFFAQGDMELAKGIAPSPLCDRTVSLYDGYLAQKDFLNFAALPLFQILGDLEGTQEVTHMCLSNVKTNIAMWTQKAEIEGNKSNKDEGRKGRNK
eukprot:GHVP01029564.1.p1 GENE.GHVP01029564.1~~GHVP01029564.1.p1  ORF type:complete len:759 (-),score=116.24 GHVP01029564.1:2523-4799(-)